MIINLLILQIIAHILADFVFQSQKWSLKKENKIFSATHIFHVFIVGTLSYILSLDPGFWPAALAIAFSHLLIDVLKSFLIKNGNGRKYFFIDQIFHLSIILLIVYLYGKYSSPDFLFIPETKTIAILGGFILCAKPSNIILKHIFLFFSIKTPEESGDDPDNLSLPNAGKLIGITERFLVLAFIISGQFSAVGFLIAAKSILRFNAHQKNEYILVGTLLSFAVAVFTGIAISFL